MKYRAWIKTDKHGSDCEVTFEIDDAELAEMSDDEREKYVQEYARELVFNHVEWSYEEEGT